MYVIGISAYYHDSSACLFKDGKLMFACEEEKFTGIKHDNSFPHKTIQYIFQKYKLKKENIDTVCYYENPDLKLKRVINNIKPQFFKNPIYSIKSYVNVKKNISELKKELSKVSDNIFYSNHHESHLYYSYYSSDFNDAIVLSIDGVGEIDTITMGIPNILKNGLHYISIATYPHSLGLFYSAMTSFLGFRPNEGEYKVMGLASYGDSNQFIEQVRKLIKYENGLICNMDVFTWNKSNKTMFNEKLAEIIGIEQRLPEEIINKNHEDLAAAVQKRYEEIFFKILKTSSMVVDNHSNLCLGGGCSYNGTANGKITDNSIFKNLWIPPAPSDAGSAIGACLNYLVKNDKLKERLNKNPFMGPQYYDNDIISVIKKNIGNRYHKFYSDLKLKKLIAEELKKGKVIGWYRGHCEFGARALGNRSILANPMIDGMKDRINKVIKKREGFRPFAPMVIKEKQNQFFELNNDVPYMNQVVKVKPEYVKILNAVTHVDGTARVQTVYPNSNIHDLLLEFEKITGYPILLNTSFNVKDKTMVLTPKDAMDTFYDTDIDILVMENYVIYKNKI
jgi:carbamoyltransferase